MTKSKNFRLCLGCRRRTTLVINKVVEHVYTHKHLYIPIHKTLPQFLKDEKKNLRIEFEKNLSAEEKILTKRIIVTDSPTMKKKKDITEINGPTQLLNCERNLKEILQLIEML